MKSTLRIRAALSVGALMTTVGLGAVATPLMAAANAATPSDTPSSAAFTAELNDPDAWCEGGSKTEYSGPDSFTYTLAADAGILVLKAGTMNYWWTDAEAGTYTVPGDHAISHVIVCPVVEESETPTDPATTPPVETTPPVTETPTDPATVTTTPAETESVEGSSTTAAASLAHTGGNGLSGLLLVAGLLLLGGGAALMLMTRRTGGSHA